MAPEVSTGNYDERVDIFSFGLVVYYLETGKEPLYTSYEIPVCDQLDFGLIYPQALPYFVRCLTAFDPSERLPLSDFIFFKKVENYVYRIKTYMHLDWSKFSDVFSKLDQNAKNFYEIVELFFMVNKKYQMFRMGYGFSYIYRDFIVNLVAIDYFELALMESQFLYQGYTIDPILNEKYLLYTDDEIQEIKFSMYQYYDFNTVAIDFNYAIYDGITNGYVNCELSCPFQKDYILQVFEEVIYIFDMFPSFLVRCFPTLIYEPKPNIDYVRYYRLVMESYEKNTLVDMQYYIMRTAEAINNYLFVDAELIPDFIHMAFYLLRNEKLKCFAEFEGQYYEYPYENIYSFNSSIILAEEAIDIQDFSCFVAILQSNYFKGVLG